MDRRRRRIRGTRTAHPDRIAAELRQHRAALMRSFRTGNDEDMRNSLALIAEWKHGDERLHPSPLR